MTEETDELDRANDYLDTQLNNVIYDSVESITKQIKFCVEALGMQVPSDIDNLNEETIYKVTNENEEPVFFVVEVAELDENKYTVYASLLTEDEMNFVNSGLGEVLGDTNNFMDQLRKTNDN